MYSHWYELTPEGEHAAWWWGWDLEEPAIALWHVHLCSVLAGNASPAFSILSPDDLVLFDYSPIDTPACCLPTYLPTTTAEKASHPLLPLTATATVRTSLLHCLFNAPVPGKTGASGTTCCENTALLRAAALVLPWKNIWHGGILAGWQFQDRMEVGAEKPVCSGKTNLLFPTLPRLPCLWLLPGCVAWRVQPWFGLLMTMCDRPSYADQALLNSPTYLPFYSACLYCPFPCPCSLAAPTHFAHPYYLALSLTFLLPFPGAHCATDRQFYLTHYTAYIPAAVLPFPHTTYTGPLPTRATRHFGGGGREGFPPFTIPHHLGLASDLFSPSLPLLFSQTSLRQTDINGRENFCACLRPLYLAPMPPSPIPACCIYTCLIPATCLAWDRTGQGQKSSKKKTRQGRQVIHGGMSFLSIYSFHFSSRLQGLGGWLVLIGRGSGLSLLGWLAVSRSERLGGRGVALNF